MYDNEGNICGIRYGENYFFQKNLQGDVISIKDSKGNTVARYRYDAWGVPTIVEDISTNDEDWEGDGIAAVNPFRYRGYYYDNETGLYYLQSRYYDPTTGRFINADNIEIIVDISKIDSLLGNIFAYCANNPINMLDTNGYCYFYNNSWRHHSWEFSSPSYVKIGDPRNFVRKVESTKIDTDGASKTYSSGSHQSGTSLTLPLTKNGHNRKYIESDKINYVVIPGSPSKCQGVKLGDVAYVYSKEKRRGVWAIVADTGYDHKAFGEVSLKTVWNLGYNEKKKNGMYKFDGHEAPETKFTILYFRDSNQNNWIYPNLQLQINIVGRKYEKYRSCWERYL